MLTYLANDFRYEIGRFHHIQHSELRPFPRQGPLARTQYHHQPTPRFGQKVVQFITSSIIPVGTERGIGRENLSTILTSRPHGLDTSESDLISAFRLAVVRIAPDDHSRGVEVERRLEALRSPADVVGDGRR